MKRIQLFEFEDFSWFPAPIRVGMTNLIMVLHRMLGTSNVLSNLLLQLRKRHHFTQIVDLGSGSGGAMPDVIKKVNACLENESLTLLLTDLHPSVSVVKQINQSDIPYLKYSSKAIDATNFIHVPKGLKTMINSFHHMPPKKAKTILREAQKTKSPILIYEMSENFVPLLVWWLFLPISLILLFVMALVMTPFVRHLHWKQLVFTYLIPIIPVAYAWDGQASLVRTYTFTDIELLLKDIKSETYKWEIAPVKKENGKKLGYYILGLPIT